MNKDKSIMCRMTKTEFDKLDNLSKENGVSRSEIIRRLINSKLQLENIMVHKLDAIINHLDAVQK